MGNRPYNAGKKIVGVTDRMGVKGIQNMQGTTRVIYDSVEIQSSANNSSVIFFENVNTRKFPFTNISENKLQVGETIAMQRFSIMVMGVDATGKITGINPLSSNLDTEPLYRSDLNISIAQDQVVKKLPLHVMYAPFNRNSNFVSGITFGNNPGITTTFQISHDVFHFDNPIVIPPQIEFTATLQIPAITLNIPVGSKAYLVMTMEGLGSLFAPKSTY